MHLHKEQTCVCSHYGLLYTYIQCICRGCMYLFLSLSLCVAHTVCVLLFWLLVADLSLCILLFPFDKAWGRSLAPQPSCSPSPHTHSSRWGVFSSPACHSPAAVPSATCDSSSTWPPSTPAPSHPNPLQACFPWLSENTPQQAWHTCQVPSRSPASNPKWLSRRHAHAHDHTYDTHRRISVQLNSHNDTHSDAEV